MATMIPPQLPRHTPQSERTVFDKLQSDPAAEGWIALHSTSVAAPGVHPREVDFIILIPDFGIICVEVKGGAFTVSQGQWRTASSGQAIESPVHQAEQAMYALKDELVRQFKAGSAAACAPLAAVVIFPDARWPDAVRRPARQIIDHEDLNNPRATIGTELLKTALRFRNAVRANRNQQLLTAATANQIRRYLAPDFELELVPASGASLNLIAERLLHLTNEQYEALGLMQDNDQCWFQGAAGTGKTMLALESARRAATDGQQVILLCYNRILGQWLARQTDREPNILAGSFWAVMRSVIRKTPLHNEFTTAIHDATPDDLYNAIFPDFARRALRRTGATADLIIVDEAQDLCREPHLELMNLTLNGGLKDGRWAMFGDFDNQALFLQQNSDPQQDLARYGAKPARRRLTVNCRNTPAIARHTALVSGAPAPPTHKAAAAGPVPSYRYWNDHEELNQLLHEEISRLLDAAIDVTSITVLSDQTLDRSGFARSREYAGHRLHDYSNMAGIGQRTADGRIKFCTVQAFKGLESPVVILTLNRLADARHRATAYVGMSRASAELVVLAHQELANAITAKTEFPPAA